MYRERPARLGRSSHAVYQGRHVRRHVGHRLFCPHFQAGHDVEEDLEAGGCAAWSAPGTDKCKSAKTLLGNSPNIALAQKGGDAIVLRKLCAVVVNGTVVVYHY